jgi:ATP-binding cassette subfamily F protein uup
LWQKETENAANGAPTTIKAPVLISEPQVEPAKKKLTYKEKREFELLQEELATLEKEKNQLQEKLSGGSTDFNELKLISERIGAIDQLLQEKEYRWLELSELTES